MKQGEKLLLLIRRSGKQVKEVAEAFDVLPTSLSRMFKSETLTIKVKKKAISFFELSEGYFDEIDPQDTGNSGIVQEPDVQYLPIEQRIKALRAQADRSRDKVIKGLLSVIDDLQEDNQELKDIIEQLSNLSKNNDT